MSRLFRDLPSRLARLRREDAGLAAVEMAFLAPVALGFMSLALAGGYSLTLYRKTAQTAHIVTDLVSRTAYALDPSTANAERLDQSDLDTDLALSQFVFYPYDTTNLKIVVSELKVNAASNQGTVVWSEAYNGGSALAVGSHVSLDPAYAATGAAYLVYGQVNYTFTPLSGVFSLPSITLTSSDMLTIRNAQQITVNWGS